MRKNLTLPPDVRAGLALALLAAVLLPLNLLASQPLHHDEALYATWALQIVSGRDPWLTHTPIDKPPLFLYILAGTMSLLGNTATVIRLPSLAATVLSLGLTFALGRKLYSPATGLLAAWLVALSPFTILFAPTALTDPLLVLLVLAACLAAAYGRPAWAGVGLGLTIATKQQGLFFVPLALGLMAGGQGPGARERFGPVLGFLGGLAGVLLPLAAWDLARSEAPAFLAQSLVNYGGLSGDPAGFGWRWAGFLELLQYATGSPLLNLVFLAGLPILLLTNLVEYRSPSEHSKHDRPLSPAPLLPRSPAPLPPAPHPPDWLLALFCLLFIIAHTVLSFQVWDRYLLGLIPLLALLLARILLLPGRLALAYWPGDLPAGTERLVALALALLLALTMARPVQDALHGRYPLGSNSGALAGIEQIAAYLRGQVGANHTLYHHWLGTHWRFYLWNYPYDLLYWDSPSELAARARPGHLIAFPAWQSDTPARLALAEAGLTLQEVARAYHPAGYPSIILYRIEPLSPGESGAPWLCWGGTPEISHTIWMTCSDTWRRWQPRYFRAGG